jgi:hypothetical protein
LRGGGYGYGYGYGYGLTAGKQLKEVSNKTPNE